MAIAAVVLFVVVLAIIAADFADRTKLALAGAGLMVLIGALGAEEAIEAVDWSTLGLLVGMMILVGLTERTGAFTWLALRVAQLSNGSPFRLVVLLALLTGVLSAFLDNLTTVLLVVPVTLTLCRLLGIPVIPLVLIEIIASNIGGTATLIGDPPNILIGTHVDELSFLDFIVNLAPVAMVTLVAATLVLYLVYRSQLSIAPERRRAVAELDPWKEMGDRRFLWRSVAVLVGTIVAFFLHTALHVEPPVVALVGATLLLVLTTGPVEETLQRVDWATILFFVGLFVMVGGLEQQGVLEDVSDWLAELTNGSRVAEGMAILWGSALGSALVDNIPFTTAMLPVVDGLQADGATDDALWWALALGACFGGNATVIAAAANVAATGVLTREGEHVSFRRFLAVGVPITLMSLLIATAYLLVFQL